jgi:hypothetical protein
VAVARLRDHGALVLKIPPPEYGIAAFRNSNVAAKG